MKGLGLPLALVLLGLAAGIAAQGTINQPPVMRPLPAPVVGDAESSPPLRFVFPDALLITDYASDDSSPAKKLLWSYEGSSRYLLNGTAPLNRKVGENPVRPGAKAFNTAVRGGELDPDGDPATITIRNSYLSPIGGPDRDPGSTYQAQYVRLYASDGERVADQYVWFYTEKGGHDRLIGDFSFERSYEADFEGNTDGWTYSPFVGACTSSTANGTAICIETALSGSNAAWWSGPFGMLTLVKNNVYRIRANIQGSQAAGWNSNVPFWDVTINNFKFLNNKFYGLSLYGMNYFVLDNVGRANAAIQREGGTDFEFWWCPSPISTAEWNVETDSPRAGPFAPINATNKNGFLEFRILDDGYSGPITGNNDWGSLCLTHLSIDRVDIHALSTVSTPLNLTSLTPDSRGRARANATLYNYNSTWGDSTLTLTPTSAGKDWGVVQVQPGDGWINHRNLPSLADDYPVPMQPQRLYLITIGISAPTVEDAANPPDTFWVGADTPSNELINLSYVTGSSKLCAMPTTTVKYYKALFWSNYATASSNPAQFKAFRPRFMMGNTIHYTFAPNTGSVRLHSMRVDEVEVEVH